MAGVSLGSRAPRWRSTSALRPPVQATDAGGLVLRACDALQCRDREVLRAVAIAVGMMPRHNTVTSWARALGVQRQALHELFATRGLPPPKVILDHLRLASLARCAGATGATHTRETLATQFRYSSGDYLGKVTKRCLRMTLRSLIARGPDAALEHLAGLAQYECACERRADRITVVPGTAATER